MYIQLSKMIDQILQKHTYQVCPHHSNHRYIPPKSGRTVHPKAAQFCQNWQKLAARKATRTGQFWLPEQEPELPSSGSQNSSQRCCSGPNCAVKIGSTVQRDPGSSGNKIPQPEILDWLCTCISPVTRKKFWQCRKNSVYAPRTIQRASTILFTW